MNPRRYSFSGHESFYCKPLWLKKGYDALCNGVNFSSPKAVAALGVGKNMVSSIRFWMRAFGLCENDIPSRLADLILADDGYDPFIEDEGTLWLLHYLLIKNNIASIYNIAFLEFQRERKEFDRSLLQAFIKRKCGSANQKNLYNENTVRKDIGVFLHNYVMPSDTKTIEDFSAIFLTLGLIRKTATDRYLFNDISPDKIDRDILLYILLDYKGGDRTVSVDSMQELSLIFGLPLSSFVEILKDLSSEYPDLLSFSDNSGVKNLQFIKDMDADLVLKKYYSKK